MRLLGSLDRRSRWPLHPATPSRGVGSAPWVWRRGSAVRRRGSAVHSGGSAVHLNEEEASAVQKSERRVHLGHHQVQAGHSRGLAHNSTASHVSVVNLVLLPPPGGLVTRWLCNHGT